MRAQLLALLILADTLVLLALILAPTSTPVAIVIPIVLIVLIMVVGGAARYLPATLRAVAQILRRR